ncbi:hypothetical protein SP90_10500 [Halodesulfovibrio spirochaetisodalis]|uniref:Uncharacterized protein n=1 Tax=Halodesulfovibrio spirochaetisodalis TaxID=1560234 RepID=A0A1B7XBQ7_9BACT|nr:hypothetical protein SP90_10500 [Halodesulfovibrio spirochaetisodalis]
MAADINYALIQALVFGNILGVWQEVYWIPGSFERYKQTVLEITMATARNKQFQCRRYRTVSYHCAMYGILI